MVFVNTSHPFAKRDQIKLEELQGQRFVHRELGSTTRLAFQAALDKAGVTVDPVMQVGSREAVWLAVERGIGIAVVSDVEFNPHPNLRTLKISDTEIVTTAHITCLTDRVESKLIKTFFDIAESIPHSQRISS